MIKENKKKNNVGKILIAFVLGLFIIFSTYMIIKGTAIIGLVAYEQSTTFEAEGLLLEGRYEASDYCACENPSDNQCVKHEGHPGQIGSVIYSFNLEEGLYDIIMKHCPEDDGDDTYRLYINDNLIETFQETSSTVVWEEHIFDNIDLNQGDEIRISCTRPHGSTYCRIDQITLKKIRQTVNINETIEDADQIPINSTIRWKQGGEVVQESSGEMHDYELEAGDYELEIIPEHSSIRKIKLDKSISSDITDIVDVDEIISPDTKYSRIYAIDPKDPKIEDAIVTITATGTELFKCRDWDFEARTCPGENWIKLMDTVPGQEYSFAVDCGYKESGGCSCKGIRFLDLFAAYTFNDGDSYTVTAKVYKGSGTWSYNLIDSETVSFSSLPQTSIDNNNGHWWRGNLIIEEINESGILIRFHNRTKGKLLGDNTFKIIIKENNGDDNDDCDDDNDDCDDDDDDCDECGSTTVLGPDTIHTSCSQPINIGDVYGDFEVRDIDKILSGSDCPLGFIFLISPSNNSNVLSPVTFIYSVYDSNQSIAFCELIIDGSIYQTDYSIIELFPRYFNQSLSNGTYEWSINCTTSNGYEIESEIRSVTTGAAPSALSVTNLQPAAGSAYNVSSNVTISAEVTSGFAVDATYAAIDLPDGSAQQLSLTNVGGDVFEGILENPIQKGRYNITIFANDTNGNVNNTEKTYFIRIVPLNRIFDVVDSKLRYVDYASSIMNNASGMLTLKLDIEDDKIKEIIVNEYDETSPYSVIKLEDPINENDLFDRSYMVDLSDANLTSANVTITSAGYHLFKCADFNITALECNDDEDFIQIITGITEGGNYTLILNKTDPGFGETIQGPANTTDSYLREQLPNNNYGGSTRIIAGTQLFSSRNYRGIIWFNLSHIPNNSIAESANLSLYFYDIPGIDTAGDRTHGVHRIQQSPARPWEELDVTWNDYNSSNSWTTAGGDFNATPTDIQNLSSAVEDTWIAYNVTVDVQDFINNPSTNFGWIIKDQDESTILTRRYYRSSEYWNISLTPKLDISFSVFVDATPPIVALTSPANNSVDIDGYVVFNYNVTDNESDISYCELIINNSVVDTDYTITENISQSFTEVLTNGTYNWSINCTNTFNLTGSSEARILNVNITAAPPSSAVCCGISVSTTPEVASQDEKVLISADIVDLIDGLAATPADVIDVNATIYRIENGSYTTIVDNVPMAYLSDGLWYYEFFVGNNASGSYIASVTMLTNQTIPFVKEASDAFTIGEKVSGLTITGVSPDLININKIIRLAAEIKYNGIAVDESLITNASLFVQKLNGTNQTYIQNVSLQAEDGIIYIDGSFNETGIYYLDWSAAYLGKTRIAREIVVVVGWEELLEDINETVNIELVNLIKESRQYLVELLTDMEFLQQFTEEEIFLITDSVNSMSKVINYLETGKITNQEAEEQFNQIREELENKLGIQLTGSTIGLTPEDIKKPAPFKNLSEKLSDWRLILFIVLLLIFSMLMINILMLARMIQFQPRNQTAVSQKQPKIAGKRRYHILIDKIKQRIEAAKNRSMKAQQPGAMRTEQDYTKSLNEFVNQAYSKGYTKGDIKISLINNGWPVSLVDEYCNKFFKEKEEQ
jgi:hypothetical protein